MYLLRTRDATLHHFNRSDSVKYAILSHVWQNPAEENSFVDIINLSEECAQIGENPRDRVCDKIRECCLFAESAGYEWVWIDTCCIDHNSSAELSEAINSMFAWYADADICYAYLYDVGNDENPASSDSSFRRSRWFERGWTLQELIAPTREIFLSQTWHTLGSKHMLAQVVEEVTGVDRDILTHKRPLDSVSVAQRMSWASRRRTTRVEDRAYSLLGIFGINIPTIYGEGERAFIRLQEEILMRIPDQTIFAWGPIYADVKAAHEIMEQGKFTVEERTNDPIFTAFDAQARLQNLLAPSPSEFANAAGYNPIPIKDLASRFRLQARISQYRLSSYGLQFCLPLSDYKMESWKSWMARTGTATTQHVQVGLLACETADGELIVLFLRHANSPTAGPQYAVGEFLGGTEQHHYHRGAVFARGICDAEAQCAPVHPVVNHDRGANSDGGVDSYGGTDSDGSHSEHPATGKTPQLKEFQYTRFTLRDIYIHHQGALQVASYTRQDGTIREIMATRDHFTFTLPSWLLTRLAERYGLLPMQGALDESTGLCLKVPFRPSNDQINHGCVASVSFGDPVGQKILTLVLGVGGCMCLRAPPPDGVLLHKLWIDVCVGPLSSQGGSASAQGTSLRKISGPAQTMPSCHKAHVDFTMVRADDLKIKFVFGEGEGGAERRVEIELRKWEGFERIRPIMCQSHVITFDLVGKAYECSSLPLPEVLSLDEVPPPPLEETIQPVETAPDGEHPIAQVPTDLKRRAVRFSSPESESQTCVASGSLQTTVPEMTAAPFPARWRYARRNLATIGQPGEPRKHWAGPCLSAEEPLSQLLPPLSMTSTMFGISQTRT